MSAISGYFFGTLANECVTASDESSSCLAQIVNDDNVLVLWITVVDGDDSLVVGCADFTTDNGLDVSEKFHEPLLSTFVREGNCVRLFEFFEFSLRR